MQENRGIDPPEGPHPIKYFKSPNPKTNENDLLTNLTSFTEGKKKEERLIDSTHTHSLALNRRKRSLHCVIEAKEEKKKGTTNSDKRDACVSLRKDFLVVGCIVS